MDASPIQHAVTSDTAVAVILGAHPHVQNISCSPESAGLTFVRNDKTRALLVGDAKTPLIGLVELMDNNPLVCADEFSVPDPASTLALIALGPLADAGLILEAPVFSTNLPVDEQVLKTFLATVSWTGDVTLDSVDDPLGGLCIGRAIVAIQNPSEPQAIEGLYDERFSRSFFVRRTEMALRPEDVLNTPFAYYTLQLSDSGAQEAGLLAVRVIAHLHGKCGATQIVHAMNVMAGFEETAGLETLNLASG